MRNKLLFGRSIDTGSWVHGVDPRAKLTGMVLYLVAIVAVGSWPALAVAAAFSIAYMLSTKIPLKYYLKAAKPLWVLMVFIFVVQCLTVESGAALWRIGSWTLYSGGVSSGLIAAFRMGLLVSFTAILTFTTTPGLLNQGLSGVLKPLRRVGISSERLTLMMSIALRFIPTILDETHKILKAQAARGADLKELPWKEKGRMLVSLLVPVTVSAFRRAEELVLSMESRGYTIGAPRSEYHLLAWKGRDTWFVASYIILAAAAVVYRLI
ncbi:Energy-coupling factor transporter transmembrane protein EcfT [compost metagenome]|uniref:Energy-coupling factor transporter transmembrane protein EcfT n=1 Tax=Paenibacillus rhizolycopersici TaxID=2780073 RepID=A0ABS2H1Q1_9BACL|nr:MULTISPECIES: energy-coupling factor transporter transmembrane component T [Paenibacillus]MBM6994511.1 energy-coupling factor transporter transmembrane protein EcfT [Paenibacillus rhizolycopersici]GIP49938.1 energy-coupling factor transporter transmembrane protein EcfT [Paenibacillus sp. J53TS2]